LNYHKKTETETTVTAAVAVETSPTPMLVKVLSKKFDEEFILIKRKT